MTTTDTAPRRSSTDAGPAVEVVDLVKRYPKAPVDAVAGMSFQVRRGEIFGLLGPNGAGKTTTVGVLTTRVRATSGRALVDGVDVLADPVAARARLGVVPQRTNLDRSLTIRENLLFHAAYHGLGRSESAARADRLLEAFGLAERSDGKPDVFSGGQSQRVMIARALMHDPSVLFLDEPATGLDPAARLFVWDRIRDLRDAGTTVVLTTHDMDEAQALADRVGIVDRGTLLALDTPAALVAALPGSATLDLTVGGLDDLAPLVAVLDGLAATERVEPGPGAGEVRVYLAGDPAAMIPAAAAAVAGAGGRLEQISLSAAGLEDVFLELTGRTLR